MIFASVLILISIVSIFYNFNYTFIVIGVFIIVHQISGNKENSYRRILSLATKYKKLSRGIRCAEILVKGDMSIAKVYSLLDASFYYTICVVDDDFNKKFTISEKQFYELLDRCLPDAEIGRCILTK